MARTQEQLNLVSQWADLIQAEKRKIEEALESIQDYAEKLQRAADDAQQKLIGRS